MQDVNEVIERSGNGLGIKRMPSIGLTVSQKGAHELYCGGLLSAGRAHHTRLCLQRRMAAKASNAL
jgi:hypothetical protein